MVHLEYVQEVHAGNNTDSNIELEASKAKELCALAHGVCEKGLPDLDPGEMVIFNRDKPPKSCYRGQK